MLIFLLTWKLVSLKKLVISTHLPYLKLKVLITLTKLVKMNTIKLIYGLMKMKKSLPELLLTKMKKVTNVGIIMPPENIITLIPKLTKTLLMETEDILYVDPIPSMNLFLIMDLFVVLSTLLTSNLTPLTCFESLDLP